MRNRGGRSQWPILNGWEPPVGNYPIHKSVTEYVPRTAFFFHPRVETHAKVDQVPIGRGRGGTELSLI